MKNSILDIKLLESRLDKLRADRSEMERLHFGKLNQDEEEDYIIVEDIEYRLLIAQINWLAEQIEDLEKLEAKKKPILKWFLDEPSK